ncbi:cysteine hydrolase family protein [Enterovirga sp. CN4-39]|uniref:cysteine hydrolase family protein n=1 Tax=Enterovirga sp. CN4-39 TaxID=3400910 RepID=UPI003C0C3577
MPKDDEELTRGPLPKNAVHLCVDMQNIFARDTPWHTPWMGRVLPEVVRVVGAHPERTIFTRFIPAERPGEGVGTWKTYYEKWADLTLERLEPDMVELVPELARFVPPATVLDKKVYSPWFQPALTQELQRRRTDTLIVTGGETDVCVLAAVLGAVDRGYRVVVGKDCLCSSSDTAHDASITLYQRRYGQQVEVATAATIVANWP